MNNHKLSELIDQLLAEVLKPDALNHKKLKPILDKITKYSPQELEAERILRSSINYKE